jgi:SRSO17 transposase
MARKIERGELTNQELKERVGLDHFEGRGWRGWHRHVTMAIAAYAFLVVYHSKNS